MQYLLVRGKWEPLPHVLELLPKQIKMKQHSSLDQYNQSYLEGPNLVFWQILKLKLQKETNGKRCKRWTLPYDEITP